MEVIEKIMGHKWKVGDPSPDEGWKIVTEDAYIGNEDDGFEREWIATAYDREAADHIVRLHNSAVKMAKGE